jgi:hypothetical protein
MTTLTRLAQALDVSRSELLDKRPRLDGGDNPLVTRLRDALLSVDVLAGIDPRHDDGEATALPDLWAGIDQAWRDYWGGRFVGLAEALPGLIAEARITERAGDPAAARTLAQVYQVAASLLVHLGREDLAALGAERGLLAASTADDELLWSALSGTYCWALLGQARNSEAEHLAVHVAERIEPQFSTASPEQIAVWGGVILWALAAAVENAKSDAAAEYISLARVGAVRLDRDRHDYGLNFGPTQVAMQSTYAHAMLGHPDRALVSARDVRREDLFAISYGRHLLDVAQAHADTRRVGRATVTLKRAKDAAPVWFRHQALARSLVADLAERQTRLTPTLRELVGSLETR